MLMKTVWLYLWEIGDLATVQRTSENPMQVPIFSALVTLDQSPLIIAF